MMSKASSIIQQIKMVERSIDKHEKTLEQPLSSPQCYALPALAFIIGISADKAVPDPFKYLPLTLKLLI